MKKNILFLAIIALGLISCAQETLDPLEGIFPAPTEATLTTLQNSEAYKVDGVRYFVLDLTDGTNTLHATLIGKDYYLTANTYTVADESSAKNGNYIYGKTTVNGTNASDGSIIITQDGDAYTVDALLFTEDNKVYKLKWSGNITYEGDPEPVYLTKVLSAQSNLGNGVNSVTVKLASDGVEYSFDPATWSETYSGSGNYLAADIYSADGYLHEGTYTPCAVGGTIGEGEYGIGYDTEMWGMTFYNWGTCWWTVDNGTTSAEKISSGNITVSRKGSKWTITYGEEGDDIWTIFEGEIEALTAPDGPSGPVYTLVDVVSEVSSYDWATGTSTVIPGIMNHNIGLFDGEDQIANFYIILEEGNNEYSGDYPVEENIAAAGKMGNGWSAWGMEGGSWFLDENGTKQYILAGSEVSIAGYADGTYTFSGTVSASATASADNAASLTFSLNGNASGSGGGFDGVELTNFLSLTSYVSWGSNLVGMELATADVTSTYDSATWTTTYSGTGNYLKLEVYSTDGTVAAGTYKACATGGTVGEGEFGIGYDGSWGASGTTWYTVTDGDNSEKTYVTDGTLTVEVDGDNYVITLESTAVKARYTGKLSAE